jgi:5'-nucleotidase
MRKENRNSEGECYQVNGKVKAEYDDTERGLSSLRLDENRVSPQELYTICLQGYHFKNSIEYLNITEGELLESGKTKVVSTSAQEVLEEYLRDHQNIGRKVEGRLVYR